MAGFDIGFEQKSKGSAACNIWYSSLLIARYWANDKLAVATRAEFYADRNGVLILTGTPNGFQTMGYSFNIDYSPLKKALIRLEARAFNSCDAIFSYDNKPSYWNFFIVSSIAVNI